MSDLKIVSTPTTKTVTRQTSGLINQLKADLGLELKVPLSQSEAFEIINIIVNCNPVELELLKNNPHLPVALCTIIASLQADMKWGRMNTLETLWKILGTPIKTDGDTKIGVLPDTPVSRETYAKLLEKFK